MILVNDVFINFTKFPSGETHLRKPLISIDDIFKTRQVTLKFESNDDIINLLLLDNYFKQYEITYILTSLYLPSSRQDRVQGNESNTLEVYTNLFKSLTQCDRILYLDPHSSAAPAALGCLGRELTVPLPSMLENLTNPVFVSPDFGALKRTRSYAKESPVLIADKVRDYVTGEITKTELVNPKEEYQNRPFIVTDDICDGGRTFIELAKVLQAEYGDDVELHLYVTHGFFTKGTDVLTEAGYDSISYQNDMQKY